MGAKIAWAIGALTLLGSGAYVFVYLIVWEWHRALLSAALFLTAEIAVAAAVVLRSVRRLSKQVKPTIAEQRRRPVAPSAPPAAERFRWLEPERTFVFIPVLLGSGIVVSGVAWIIERLASQTSSDAQEAELNEELAALDFPARGLLPPEEELLAADEPFADDENLRLLLGPAAREAHPGV